MCPTADRRRRPESPNWRPNIDGRSRREGPRRRRPVTRRGGHATASSGDNALKIIEKGRSRWGHDRRRLGPAPTQILLFTTSNWHHSFKRPGSAPIHSEKAAHRMLLPFRGRHNRCDCGAGRPSQHRDDAGMLGIASGGRLRRCSCRPFARRRLGGSSDDGAGCSLRPGFGLGHEILRG
jgi:hypothetical protein